MTALLAPLLTAALAAPPPVIGGEASATAAVVALGASDGAGFLLVCSGALIRPRWVLGSAHCVGDLEAFSGVLSPEARLGADASTPTERIDLVGMHRHPEWREGAFGYDVALFELAEPSTAAPLSLAEDSLATDWLDAPVRWVGYGDTDEQGSNDQRQRQLVAPVVEADETYLRTVAAGDANLCYGDSGGPGLVTRDGAESLVAVAAFVYQDDDGGGCVGGGTAGVRARVFAPWLEARLDGGVLLGGAPQSGASAACAGEGSAAALLVFLLGGAPLGRRSRRRPPRATLKPDRLGRPPWPSSTASPTTSTSTSPGG